MDNFILSIIFSYLIVAGILLPIYLIKNKNKESKEDNSEKENTYMQMFLTHKLDKAEGKLKETELKAAYYIQIINEIEKELTSQNYNSITNLINRIKTIISEDRYKNEDIKKEPIIKQNNNNND